MLSLSEGELEQVIRDELTQLDMMSLDSEMDRVVVVDRIVCAVRLASDVNASLRARPRVTWEASGTLYRPVCRLLPSADLWLGLLAARTWARTMAAHGFDVEPLPEV